MSGFPYNTVLVLYVLSLALAFFIRNRTTKRGRLDTLQAKMPIRLVGAAILFLFAWRLDAIWQDYVILYLLDGHLNRFIAMLYILWVFGRFVFLIMTSNFSRKTGKKYLPCPECGGRGTDEQKREKTYWWAEGVKYFHKTVKCDACRGKGKIAVE